MRKSSEPNHPILSREEAEQQLKLTGYVRMDGHSATNEEQLAELYDVIFPAKEAGTYGQSQDADEAMRVRLITSGHVAAALGAPTSAPAAPRAPRSTPAKKKAPAKKEAEQKTEEKKPEE